MSQSMYRLTLLQRYPCIVVKEKVDSCRQNWTAVEFQFNKAFWAHWGHEAALPFRVRNLCTVQELATLIGLTAVPFGRTLKDLYASNSLQEDHDDDMLVNLDSPQQITQALSTTLAESGFQIIRENNQMVSVSRHNRYIDLHPAGKESPISTVEIIAHGATLKIRSDSEKILEAKYKSEVVQVSETRASLRANLERPLKSARRHIYRVVSGSQKNPQVRRLVRLSEDQFLSLRFEQSDANNWSWRERHLAALVEKGETLRESLARLSTQSFSEISRTIREVPTASPFPEPINLARDFWKMGNNFFIYPFLFGFRHQVMPYAGANLYILSGIEPRLYTKEYYAQLPKMSESEIEKFLQDRPLEITNNAFSSGRHRVAAMLGRLWRGEPYLPVSASTDDSVFFD